ncbi:MAG: dTDP-4-dehydrorhamnose 3,5-epimerase family protein [Acidobacteriota bacterium]|nr:MAG: dTDP-4-dehydrorhamnose 3,5-epimerase family protein [Acidobacteriota bacterium]
MNPAGEVRRDRQTVSEDGDSLILFPEGLSFKDVPTHIDDRGSVCELYDSRWDWHPDPLVFSYCFTIRPGMIKGWGMHKEHEDRYFVLYGEMEVVLYDDREDSGTRGLVTKVYLTQYRRRLMNIPAGVWHATRNPGISDVVVVNFPTIPYDHANPDKYRLPLDTDRIPYKFDAPAGW